jgi:hypothetical protein
MMADRTHLQDDLACLINVHHMMAKLIHKKIITNNLSYLTSYIYIKLLSYSHKGYFQYNIQRYGC